jgi:ankyrin repeat protein
VRPATLVLMRLTAPALAQPATAVLMLCLALAGACRPIPDSALVQAAAEGRGDEVARLLARGAGPGERSTRGSSALALAARAGHAAVIEQLIKAGADPDIRDRSENEWTPLLHAVDTHQQGAVRTLLSHGADPNLGSGLTPLIMAAGFGDTGMVRLLLDRGADPHVRMKSGENALGAAVGKCRTDTVRLLLERAPDLRLEMFWASRPMTWAARLGGCRDVVDMVRGWQSEGVPVKDGPRGSRR